MAEGRLDKFCLLNEICTLTYVIIQPLTSSCLLHCVTSVYVWNYRNGYKFQQAQLALLFIGLCSPASSRHRPPPTNPTLGRRMGSGGACLLKSARVRSEGPRIGSAPWTVRVPSAVFTYTHSSVAHNNIGGGVLSNEAFRSGPWPICLQWAVVASMQKSLASVFITRLGAGEPNLDEHSERRSVPYCTQVTSVAQSGNMKCKTIRWLGERQQYEHRNIKMWLWLNIQMKIPNL